MVPSRRRKYPLSPEASGASLWRDLLAEQLRVLEKKTVKGKAPKIQKEPLEPQRVRRIPAEGFSWIDRRFVREGFIERLPPEAILLYLFLVAVSDARGLSFYADATISRILQLDDEEITQARARLVTADLILYRYPLYQVLALPQKKGTAPAFHAPSPGSEQRSGALASLGEILQLAKEEASHCEESSAETLGKDQVPKKQRRRT